MAFTSVDEHILANLEATHVPVLLRTVTNYDALCILGGGNNTVIHGPDLYRNS